LLIQRGFVTRIADASCSSNTNTIDAINDLSEKPLFIRVTGDKSGGDYQNFLTAAHPLTPVYRASDLRSQKLAMSS